MRSAAILSKGALGLVAWLIFLCEAHAGWPPALPNIPAYITNVTQAPYNASTGAPDNAAAINAAISDINARGGGTVEIPGPGTYLCGPLTMKGKVNLQIDGGATLMMLPMSSWSGTTPFLLGLNLTDVEISGSGTIDGQGAGWSGSGSRPNFIQFDHSYRILIQDVKLQNPPTFHLFLKASDGDVTIQRINIDTDPTSPNTDGMDIGSTNMLIQNCHISDGDDNIEIGGSSGTAADIVITNCMFGRGHGVSLGSFVGAGVSNITVINCTFTNTDYAIRMKSDAGRGGVVQNMTYCNIGMTNIKYAPILIYSYYNAYGNPTINGITPSVAQSTAIGSVSSTTPLWRNIVISNVTATAGQPGMIWARTELPATNIVLQKLNITSSDAGAGNGSFALYNARGVQVVDCQIHVAGSAKKFELFNCGTTFSNSTMGASAITLDGIAVTNGLAFYNQPASLSDGTAFGARPISLSASTLADGTSLTLASTTPVNFTLGANAAQIAVTGSLTLNNTNNIAAGPGFGAGVYTLYTYTGTFSGTPIPGLTPSGYNYSLTNGSGKVNLVVSTASAPVPFRITAARIVGSNQFVLTWDSVASASYRVESEALLGLGNWTTSATVMATGPVTSWTNTGISGVGQRLYRVVQTP